MRLTKFEKNYRWEDLNPGQKAPKISIVITSFNQAAYLESAIQSLLDQNYPNLELVVIDGNSQDHSVEIIKKYSKNLSYWISEPDNGHASALNKGFKKTSGEIMGWLNSDDAHQPNSLNAIGSVFLTHEKIDWICGLSSIIDLNGNSLLVERNHISKYSYINGEYQWIQQEATFWRRSLWITTGGMVNEEYKFMVDNELWSRFFIHSKIWFVNAQFGSFRTHTTNRSHLFQKEVDEEMEIIISNMRKQHRGLYLKAQTYRIFRVIERSPAGYLGLGKLFATLLLLIGVEVRHLTLNCEGNNWKIKKIWPDKNFL